MSSISTVKLGDTVGAEITGIDRERLITDNAVPGQILDELERHGVLVFRGLHLDPDTQVQFCSRLGDIDYSAKTHRIPGIYVVTLDRAKNAMADYLKGTFDWHIDGLTPVRVDELPIKATVLTAVAVAESGGDTEFASAYAAYDDLSDEEKERFETLRVAHALEASQRRRTPHPTPEQEAAWRSREPHVHPLVWRHKSGRRSLVLGTSASHVVGMPEDEGQALLDELLARATVPERVYRHRWAVGDTVIWDNTGVLHRATPYDADSAREMNRTTLLGEEPVQ